MRRGSKTRLTWLMVFSSQSRVEVVLRKASRGVMRIWLLWTYLERTN